MRFIGKAVFFVVVAAACGCGPIIEERLVGTWSGTIDGSIDRSKPLVAEFADAIKRDGPLSLTLKGDATFELSVDNVSGDWQRAGPMIVLTGKGHPSEGKPVLGIQPVVRILPMDQNKMKWEPTPGVTVLWRRIK